MDLKQSYDYCKQLANSHYENFPVASILLPKRLRKPISVIYAFARTADDFADEGNASQQTRLLQLDNYSDNLEQINHQGYQGQDPIFIALDDVIKTHELPLSLFEDLLSAFKQDVVKSRYVDFDEVIDYCTRSANPVGRLLLLLAEEPTIKQLQQSDAICSALQLINFYQDIVQDITESDRVYIPKNELVHHGISEQQLTELNTVDIAPLIRKQYQRAHTLMASGTELGQFLTGRLGWEVRAMTLAGIVTLDRLMSQDDHSLLARPRLSKLTLLTVLFNSFCKTRYRHCADKLLNKH